MTHEESKKSFMIFYCMTKKSERLILVNILVRSWNNSSLCIHLVMRFEIIISWTKTPQSHFVYFRRKTFKKVVDRVKVSCDEMLCSPQCINRLLLFRDRVKFIKFHHWRNETQHLHTVALSTLNSSNIGLSCALTLIDLIWRRVDWLVPLHKKWKKKTRIMQRANKMMTTKIEELVFSVNLRRAAGEDEISQIKKDNTRRYQHGLDAMSRDWIN